jgi:hypothetical protein
MVVPVIAMPVRSMDGEIDCDAIALCEGGSELAHSLQTLLMRELVR